MGNDSNIKKKSKQRTTIHKKHQVFPGMRLSPEVLVQSGSIKPKNRSAFTPIKETAPKSTPKEHSDMWEKYDKAAKQLGVHASSATLQMRRAAEDTYVRLYKQLYKLGQVNRIKKKYRG